MKEFITNYKTLMSGCETPLDYIMAVWVNVLLVMSFSGIGMIAYELITNPTQFNDVTWGIFDTLG